MTEPNLYGLIANLVQELIDSGYKVSDLIWLMKHYGLSEEEIKEWYGIPYEQ
jgi:hypothetical protein